MMTAWLGLVGLKISYFLTEPTTLLSRLDHTSRKLPNISIALPSTNFAMIRDWFINENEGGNLFDNQTLLDLFRSYGPVLAEYTGISNMSDDERRQRRTETTIRDSQGTWRQTLIYGRFLGATVEPVSSRLRLYLPRNEESYINHFSKYVFLVMFQNDRVALTHIDESTLRVENVSEHRHVRISIERHINLNLKRLPCEEDPNKSIAVCQSKCFFKSMDCSIEGEDRRRTERKPICMASDVWWYMSEWQNFHFGTDVDEAPMSRCPCRPSCVQNRITYTSSFDTTKSTNDNIRLVIYMSPERHTREMVLTYGLEDLLADIGGYLGLLLGVSLLSLCGSGHRLARRLTRRVRQRRDGAQPATGLRDASGAESAWSLERDVAASELCPVSPEHRRDSAHDDIVLPTN